MPKRLAILGAWALLGAGIMVGQPNQAASGKDQPAGQGHPSVISADGHNKQDASQTDQAKAGNRAPVRSATLKWPAWMGDSSWWLVIIAGVTGSFIAWQSWETRKAAKGALLTAQVSRDQIEIMKSTERAQLRIELFPPDFLYKREAGGYEVRFTVFNDGTTRAYVLEDSLIAYVADKPRKGSGWPVIGLHRNFLPEQGPFGSQTAIRKEECVFDNETDPAKIAQARQGEITLFVNGRIWYRDIFRDEWILDIDRYWDLDVRSWGPVGSGRGDGHRKVDTSYRDKPPKPN